MTFISKYMSKKLDFRVRLFNVLAMAGTGISLVMALLAVINSAGFGNLIANLLSGTVSFGLLTYSQRSGNYRRCYTLTIIMVFLILFPALFFSAGAYMSGMPCFFVFAVVFTVFMLEGWRAVLFSALEAVVYIAVCLIAYRYPETVIWFSDRQEILIDVIVGFITVSAALGISLFLHFRLYNEQQRRLDEQNRTLEQLNQMKTEFYANVSHEVKTPLTVVSVHVQRAAALLKLGREGDEQKINESLALAHDETMRISRLVDSALKLSSLEELGWRESALDMNEILSSSAEAYRAVLERRANELTKRLPDEPSPVSGRADALVQLVSNLISNANAHTRGGQITVSAEHRGALLAVTVGDSGEGIAPEDLPHVFERGVSGSGGSGLGLAICSNIVRSHGGEISIASEKGRGTEVTFTLPLRKGDGTHD